MRFAFVLEVDPTTNEVLRRLDFTDARGSLYRAQWVDGCDLFANARYCPSLAR